jgi:IclR family transcriptional regulator, pca regulon regulatory protein
LLASVGQNRKHDETTRVTNAVHGASEFAEFEGDPDFVLSLARGLAIIEAFEGHKEGLSVADLSRQTGLSRAAVRRVLITLQTLGYAELMDPATEMIHRFLPILQENARALGAYLG